eukprot:6771352-Prymnesium_polylepis.2
MPISQRHVPAALRAYRSPCFGLLSQPGQIALRHDGRRRRSEQGSHDGWLILDRLESRLA